MGAKRLVAIAEKFGFFEQPDIPAAKISTIPEAEEMKDAIAVGSAAIGQNTDLATPLQMASVAATIANKGVRVKPHLAGTKRVRTRVVSAKVAAQVRDMMIAVVAVRHRQGRRDPGRHRGGQDRHGRARLHRRHRPERREHHRLVRRLRPATNPKVAVAVMLPNAGQGGASAAPIAKRVLQAAL